MKFLILIVYLFSCNCLANEELTKAVESINNLNQTSDALRGPVDTFCSVSIHSEEEKSELAKKRKISAFMDKCLKAAKFSRPTTFEEAIKLAISESFKAGTNQLDPYVSKVYGVSSWKDNVGLISHPMCEDIDTKLYSGKSSTKIARLKAISQNLKKIPMAYNKLRTKYLKSVKDKKPKIEIENNKVSLMKFYYFIMATLAEHESLSSADSKTSENKGKEFAKHYGIESFKKAPGVKFYYDSYQTGSDSKRNIGLYQFSANHRGNIAPCLKAWNENFGKKAKECKISTNSKKEAFKVLAASDQIFNAFCGVNKLVQSFGIQVNTSKFDVGNKRRTHSSNMEKNKKLKSPDKRCVSLFSDSLNTYNHYGTLGFTTSNNTKNVVEGINNFISSDH